MLIQTAGRAEQNQTDPIRLGKQSYVTKWKHSHCTSEPSRTEPDRAWPNVFNGRCLFLLASRRPILLRRRSNFLELKCVLFFKMRAITLDCEVLINEVDLRPALWEQSAEWVVTTYRPGNSLRSRRKLQHTRVETPLTRSKVTSVRLEQN